MCQPRQMGRRKTKQPLVITALPAVSTGPMTYAQFRALQDHWDAKLKASGFNDIENRHAEQPGSPSWIDRPRGRFAPATAEYYRSAEAYSIYLQNRRGSQLEREVWALHACGLGTRAICSSFLFLTRWRVRQIIAKHEKICRTWWERQNRRCITSKGDLRAEIAEIFSTLSGVPLEGGD